MNQLLDTRNRLVGPWFVKAIIRMCLAGRRAPARYNRLRRKRAHLWELSDHLLRDIGVERSEIVSITDFVGMDESRHPRD